MRLSLHFYFLFCYVVQSSSRRRAALFKYHYQAQTLERMIRAEISLETVNNDIQHMKEAMANDKMKNNADKSELGEKLDQRQQSVDNLRINITKTKDKEIPPATSSMRQFCTTNATCSDVKYSECKWMACKCKPGLSYHHGTKTCLSYCRDYGYGNTYQVEMDTILTRFSTKTFNSISLANCIQKCTTETSITCRSAEYWKDKQRCYLSLETLYKNPSAHTDIKDYVIYTRDCTSD